MGLLIILALLVTGLISPGTSKAATGDPVLLNEVLASHTGTDDTEYFELFGTPGLNLSGLSVIVVESDAFGPGAIDRRFDFKPFHKIGSNGFFLAGNCVGLPANYGVTPDASLFTNYFENSSLTVALVETASLSGDSVTGAEIVRDAVALTDGGAGDTFYFAAPVIGPDGSFFPAGARRVTDGVDTDTSGDWIISDFFLGSANTPTSGDFDGCAPIPATIPEIQGDGQRSPFEGEVVTTQGVVTLISANGRDMWIQDAAGDGDPGTSDGIFVDDRDRLDPLPEVGDRIEITATVEELQFGNALPLTQLNSPTSSAIISSGNPLPTPVTLVDLPNESILQGIDFWEPLEGMLVSAIDGPVIAATNGFGEFGFVTPADAIPGSGYFADTGHLIIRSIGTNEVDYNPERIMVDDSALDTPDVRPGDQVNSIVGVVDYTFGNYKLQVQSLDVTTNPLPSTPVSERTLGPDQGKGLGQFIRVVTYNVENLFDLFDNPDKDDIGTGGDENEAELDVHLTKLALSIEVELEEPDILVLQEVENTLVITGDENGLVPGTSVPALIPRLNGNWEAISFETSDGRGIEVAFMWQKGRVKLLDGFQITDDIVPGTGAAFGPDSPSPGREPLVGKFKVRGHELWIVGNHFKSKSGDDPLYGVNQPPIRITEVQRKAQATVVRTFVNTLLDADPSALVMVTGDLNDFQFGEPGEGADHPVAILEGGPGEVPLTNLVNLEQESERFSFVFDGNSQVLDHMLVSPGLFAEFLGVDFLHFNTSFFDTLNSDPTTPLAASDHDPLEGRFNLGDD